MARPDARPDPAEGGRPLGLQRERTLLAWNRTVLALLVATALVARSVGPPYLRLLQVPAVVLGVVAVALWLASDLRYRRPVGPHQVGAATHVRVLWLAAVAVGVGGVVAIVVG